MIVRKKRIKLQSVEVSLQVSYGTPDVKQAVKMYRKQLEDGLGIDTVRQMPITEKDTTHYFRQHIFSQYGKDMAQALASWCMAQAVANKFLIASPTKENTFYFSDELPRIGGRPRKE